MKFDFVLGDVEVLLKETNIKLENIEILLESLLIPPDLKKYMKSISKDLWVKCKFCHDLNDKAIDTDHKNIAREMMRMQIDLNKNFFPLLGDSLNVHDDILQISCWTCHRGSKYPQTIKPKK